jgi:aminoglycoside phosphotransferase (APT) family kinase protein
LRWTKPQGVQDLHGRRLYRYEFARGSLLSNELLPVSFDLARFSALFARLVDGYVELCAKMTAAAPAGSEQSSWRGLLDRLAVVPIGDGACAARIKAACARLRGRNWATRSTHGDLSLSNTMLRPDGRMILVDWENASAEGLVAVDLIRLLKDALSESRLLDEDSRRAVAAAARGIVRAALERIGVGPEDEEDAEALFVADQFRMWLSRDGGVAQSPWALNLVREFGAREFALAISARPGTRD